MIVIVMGVTGSGKTTIGRLLAERLGCAFHDADDYHPAANREKMSRDEPLDDADRWPWLELLNQHLRAWESSGPAVLACSALKQAYRDVLQRGLAEVHWVYLAADREETARRLAGRTHAYVRDYAAILAGQFRDLEVPAEAIHATVGAPPADVVKAIARLLFARAPALGEASPPPAAGN